MVPLHHVAKYKKLNRVVQELYSDNWTSSTLFVITKRLFFELAKKYERMRWVFPTCFDVLRPRRFEIALYFALYIKGCSNKTATFYRSKPKQNLLKATISLRESISLWRSIIELYLKFNYRDYRTTFRHGSHSVLHQSRNVKTLCDRLQNCKISKPR